MRGVALSVVAIAATGALAQADDAKPVFTVSIPLFPERGGNIYYIV